MVHFVCSPYCFEVGVVNVPEEFESLVDKNIMNKKIGESIQGDSHSDPEKKIEVTLHSDV